ncbi:unnamed protein product [Effrenium voratum]|uniref:Ubiquitinyl hydrolase 1 n=1 Tax=Effrenium voratum TaxID=2562239 RepID=A0AA36NG57_9DINO|nr:unnamed protein product [Effrenium voratum]
MDAEEVRSALRSAGARLRAGDDWFVLSMRWWDLWKDYTHFDRDDLPSQPAVLQRSCSGTTKGERPPEIDNSDLIIRPGSSQLQSGLGENRDFILLPQEAWKLLHAWYGGGPPLRRQVIGSGSADLRVELYPLCLTVYKVDDYGVPLGLKLQVMFSRSATVEEVINSLRDNVLLGQEEAQLWHRPSVEVDQTRIDSLEGWELLQAEESLESQAVVDGASILLEVATGRPVASASDSDKNAWPFFHRLRVDWKQKTYKDPSDPSVELEADDKIDALGFEDRKQWDSQQGEYIWKQVPSWYAATVVAAEGKRLLVQFHNRAKPKARQLEPSSLVVAGKEPKVIEVGKHYESLDSRHSWHQVRITKEFNDAGQVTYEAYLLDENNTWPVVQPENIRELSTLTEEATRALTKVFERYASGDVIQSGGVRGLLSCASNEFVPEDSPKIAALLKEPFGTPEGMPLEGFLEYWRQQIAASGGKGYWLQQDLSRLFERAKVEMRSEEEQLLQQGREWMDRDSNRLAQYRSKTVPGYQDARDFRDFQRYDQLDVRFGREWKQAEVMEVDWTEMTILVQTKQVNSVGSPSRKAQREWIPMESERLAEYETKSLEAPHEGDPGPLLARSVSRGGVCLQPGACGLQNLGNTCFINSTLQCLSNSIPLRTFFAGTAGQKPAFLEQISTSPLSTEGRIAREFSKLLRDMWSNENKSVAPASLKKLIGQKRPEFSGYQQHDAHELLCFLLDALHEDVNRAPYPYPTEEEDEEVPKSDEQRAQEMWELHKRRSDSQIVDLFQFQIRSELTCPVCSTVSVTFDPIMYLTLPVPKPPHSVSLTLVGSDFQPRHMQLEVDRGASIDQLETALWKYLGRSPTEKPSCFCFGDVCYGRIYKHFEPHNYVSEIRSTDNIFAFEVPLAPEVAVSDHTFVPLVYRKRTKPTMTSRETWQYDKLDQPRLVAVVRGARNCDVHQQLQDMATDLLKACAIPEPWSFEILTNLDIYGSRAGDLLPEDGQPFRAPSQLAIDFLEQADLLKEALPKASKTPAPGGTTLTACLQKGMEREVLAEADSVYCRKCKEHRCQSKKLDLWSLPPVLVVHLKRFGRERLDGPLVKIGCPVDFSLELDLKDYLCRKGVERTRYQLFGVVNHHGNVGGGHYTAHALVTPPSGPLELGDWFNFNDSIVSQASVEDLDKEAAYVLFFQQL